MQSDDPLRNYVWSIEYNNPFSDEEFKKSSNSSLDSPEFILIMNISHILLFDIIGEIYEVIPYFFKMVMGYSYEVYEMLLAEELIHKELSYSCLRRRPKYFLNQSTSERITVITRKIEIITKTTTTTNNNKNLLQLTANCVCLL